MWLGLSVLDNDKLANQIARLVVTVVTVVVTQHNKLLKIVFNILSSFALFELGCFNTTGWFLEPGCNAQFFDE